MFLGVLEGLLLAALGLLFVNVLGVFDLDYTQIAHASILGICTIIAALVTTHGRNTKKKLDEIDKKLNNGDDDSSK